MSRSYKKTPGWTDGSRKSVRFYKRQANKKVRHLSDIPSGRSYKKLYPTWYIHDHKSLFYSDRELRNHVDTNKWAEEKDYHQARMK